jgi:ubiquitin-protein ligase E3 C
VKIRRSAIWPDGYANLSKIKNLKEQIYVVFVNDFGVQEEGVDASGLFKEFLTSLITEVFNPNYGLFLLTEVEKQLFPNAMSHHLFANDDVNVYRFLGRILGKAMYDGITVEP